MSNPVKIGNENIQKVITVNSQDSDTQTLDAFGRLKVGSPFSMLDSVITHDTDNIYVNFLTNGTGSYSYDAPNSMHVLSVAALGDYVVEQTIGRAKYQPGKSLEFLASVRMNTETDVVKRCGFADVDDYTSPVISNSIRNGIVFENNSGAISWKIFKNGVNTETALKENWNVDKLDGTGQSGITLNLDGNILPYIDLQFLAVGTVRVGYDINGQYVIVHQFHHTNDSGIVSTYMQNANLPVHYSIESLGGSGSINAIGYTVSSGGGFDPLGRVGFVNSGSVSIASGVTSLMVGIRLKPSHFNSIVDIISTSVLSTTGANAMWMLLLNPTYSNTVTWVDVADSSIQYAVNNLNDIATDADRGTCLAAGYMSNNNDISGSGVDNALRIAKKLDGSYIELWLAVESYGSETYRAAINYKDLM